MKIQLTRSEIAEYARIKTRLFLPGKPVRIEEVEIDPDYHRYLELNRQMQGWAIFYRRFSRLSPAVYLRVQRWFEKQFDGQWLVEFSTARGLVLDRDFFRAGDDETGE
jgi:hypothetical protein